MPQINLMERAIEEAKKSGTPFGAVLFNGHRLVSAANTGKRDGKVHHAELNVLLKMPENFKNDEFPLELFTTCEPCPMCMGAAIWAGVDQIYYGVSIKTASRFLSQIDVSSSFINEHSFRKLKIYPQKMESECLQLFREFA